MEENQKIKNLDTIEDKSLCQQRREDRIKKLIERCEDENTPPVAYSICKNICSIATFYGDLKTNEELNKAYRNKELVCGVMIESKLVSKAIGGDNTCMIFYLKNKHNSYKDKIKIEGALEINNYDKLSDEELTERIRKYTEKLGKQSR